MLTKLKPRMRWQGLMLYLGILATMLLVLFLYSWRLGTLTVGMSKPETLARKSSSSFVQLKDNPVNAPHKLGQLAFQHLGHHGAFWMRSVSVAAALLFLALLFLFLRQWFGSFIAILSTLFFAATPWVALVARSATPDIMFLSPISVITCFIWLSRDKKWPDFAWLALCITTGLSLYTPGAIWFVLISLVLAGRVLMNSLHKVSSAMFIAGIALFILLLIPLGYGVYQHSSTAKTLLLYPDSWQHPVELLKSTAWSISSLFVKTRQHLSYTVGRLPILNVAAILLSVVGIYAMLKGAKKQVYLLLVLILIGILASSINNNAILLTLCLPSVAIFIAAALRYLHIKWFRVFPLNPLPKALAITFLLLLVGLQLAYGLRYTLVAWPHSVATKSNYMLK
jgi:4-amino-4-deoxy-L-arabinose transferase-like glycosyltransferase